MIFENTFGHFTAFINVDTWRPENESKKNVFKTKISQYICDWVYIILHKYISVEWVYIINKYKISGK